jgi:serine phosphatase RsbU (regulator of sigma subunit)
VSEKQKEEDAKVASPEPADGPLREDDDASPSPPPVRTAGRTGKIRRADLLKKPGAPSDVSKTSGDGAPPPKSGKSKRKKGAEKEERTLELEPISPFPRGISIGVKFAALTAVVVALAMLLLGTLTYSITVQEVDGQVNQGGVQAVSALEKGIDRVFWIKPQKTIDDIFMALTGATSIPELDPKLDNEDAKRQNQQQFKVYQESAKNIWDNLNLSAQKALTERLKTLVDGSNGQILSAAIREKPGGAIASWPEKFSAATNPLGIPPINGVEVLEGRLEMGGNEVLVRQFERPVVDERGAPVPGQTPGATAVATVWINAKKIDEVKSNVWGRIMLVTAMGALAGVILTALIAAVLSRPIRALEEDIAEVAGGDLDHETLVRSRDEIGGLAHTFNIMTRNVKAAQHHAADRKAIERELAIATEIQTKLLPERIPQIPGLDIHSFYLSAKEVGGDYYDFIVIDQTHLGIIVADVSGKGIPGSMVMTMARSLVRLASVRNVSPADTFKKVNRILAKDIRRGMFVTSIYMVLNVKTHELKVASAGHNPLVVFRAETGEYELVKPQGIALGFDKGTIFDNNIQETTIQLKPGDRVCAYTDGVNEAMNDQSEEFGDERFYNLVKQHARLSSKDFVNQIVQELEGHRGEAEQSDDITITTLAVMK